MIFEISCVVFVVIAVLIYFLVDFVVRIPTVCGLTEKSVFITGCDSGFGYLLAKRLDDLGMPVFAGCLTQKGEESIRDACSSRLKTVMIDVTKHDDIVKAFDYVLKNLASQKDGLWAVVNNAGIVDSYVPLDWKNIDDYRRVLSVNLFGVVDVTHTFLPLLKKSQGRLVNMSSITGRIAFHEVLPYSLSKHGVECFSDGCRAQLKRFGIKVVMLEPGPFRTAIADTTTQAENIQAIYRSLPDDVKANYDDAYVQRLIGSVRDINSLLNDKLDLVIDAYVHAITAVYPRKRYAVGWKTKWILIPLSYLPSFITDSAVNMASV